jgi:hypothetical protein
MHQLKHHHFKKVFMKLLMSMFCLKHHHHLCNVKSYLDVEKHIYDEAASSDSFESSDDELEESTSHMNIKKKSSVKRLIGSLSSQCINDKEEKIRRNECDDTLILDSDDFRSSASGSLSEKAASSQKSKINKLNQVSWSIEKN